MEVQHKSDTVFINHILQAKIQGFHFIEVWDGHVQVQVVQSTLLQDFPIVTVGTVVVDENQSILQ